MLVKISFDQRVAISLFATIIETQVTNFNLQVMVKCLVFFPCIQSCIEWTNRHWFVLLLFSSSRHESCFASSLFRIYACHSFVSLLLLVFYGHSFLISLIVFIGEIASTCWPNLSSVFFGCLIKIHLEYANFTFLFLPVATIKSCTHQYSLVFHQHQMDNIRNVEHLTFSLSPLKYSTSYVKLSETSTNFFFFF